ncbi:MAG: D-alanyl-D-alanine carboxypeptidase family protein [Acutalibacteraceae bacterium]
MHKKISYYFVLFFLFLLIIPIHASALESGDISAASAVVMEAQSGQVIFEKNAHTRRSMASTTKIMTAVLAVESGRINETVEISAEMCGAEGTSIGLKAGNKIKLLNLVYGMMLESGNDAANAVAVFLGKSVEQFANMMNRKALEIGMENTNFVTPSGLDDENHYTTAYDMALLGAYAMKNPLFEQIVSSKSAKVDFESPDITVTYSNHNRLLYSYDGAVGIKTGFTKKSGRCLVSAAKKNGVKVIAVTLSAPDDWNDHKKMLSYAFENIKTENIYLRIPETVHVIGSEQSEIEIKAAEYPCPVSYYTKDKITQRVFLPSFVYAPIRFGEEVGYAVVYLDGKEIERISLTAQKSCQSIEETYVPHESFFSRIKSKLKLFTERK